MRDIFVHNICIHTYIYICIHNVHNVYEKMSPNKLCHIISNCDKVQCQIVSSESLTTSQRRSFSGHSLGPGHPSFDLLSHLDYRAHRTAEISHYVAHQRTIDALELSESLSVQSTKDDQRKSEETRQTAHEAAFTKSLCILAKGVARNNEGDDAKAAIVETTAKSRLPFRHCCCC